MSREKIEEFRAERERLNEIVMKYAGTNIKRFYNIDWQVYKDGALPAKIKELLGFVASMVLRCDDCILYHLLQCHQLGISSEEIEEATSVALIVGGSIVIPHMRRALQAWDDLQQTAAAKQRTP